MSAFVEHYREILEEQYKFYSDQLLEQVPVISTRTYVLTILAICIPPIIALIFYEREQARLRTEQPKGCRKLGLKITSNLTNEYDKKFSEGRPPSTEETSAEWWRLKSLWIYPIKSCGGVELSRGTVVATGMEYDRQFTFAQLKPGPIGANDPNKEKPAHRWQFITQKQFPLLAQIRTEVWVPDQSVETYAAHADDVESGGVIILSFPYQEPGWRGLVAKWGGKILGTFPEKQFRLPFNPTPAQIDRAGYSFEKITVWNDTISALNLEIEIPEELRYYLGLSNKLGLFRVDNSKLREISINAPRKEKVGYQPLVGFQDAYPLHLINLASIRDVESKLPKGSSRLSAARFRANLIITGPDAYHEDTWRRIKIGYYEYDVSYDTADCKLPPPDPATGIRHPSETDKSLRKSQAIDDGAGPNVGYSGVQMVSLAKEAAMRVGDEITVLEVVEHYRL